MLNDLALSLLFPALWQTLYMVFVASVLGIGLGLVYGVALFNTQKLQVWQHQSAHQALGFVANVGRSVPFIILMIAIIPFTRFVVGSSIGMNAAIVPLVIAAIPYYARIAEAALSEVPHGVLEAAKAMGATNVQLIWRVLIPEALPSLIKGATLTVVGLIGYSAMAGAVGGGGLGELAINYGYQRFDVTIMFETVVVLVVLVQLIQSYGDRLARKPRMKRFFFVCFIFALFCFMPQFWTMPAKQHVLKVGVMGGVSQEIMKVAKKVAWQQSHVDLKIIPFDDYVLPNTALDNGEIGANIFQHKPYLEAQIKARGYHLVPVAKTFIYPLGFYSKKYAKLSDLPKKALVAIPNDPSNEGRALLLLQKADLIHLQKGSGLFGTAKSIVWNPKHLRFVTMNAAQIPRVLNDVAMGALTNDFVGPAGFTVKQALIREGKDSPYANIIVVRKGNTHKKSVLALIKTMHSKAVVSATEKAFPDGAAIPAF